MIIYGMCIVTKTVSKRCPLMYRNCFMDFFLYEHLQVCGTCESPSPTWLRWHHNERDVVLNHHHRRLDCLLNRLFRPGSDQRKHQRPASLAFVRRFHRYPYERANDAEIFPFEDVIMKLQLYQTAVQILVACCDTALSRISRRCRHHSVALNHWYIHRSGHLEHWTLLTNTLSLTKPRLPLSSSVLTAHTCAWFIFSIGAYNLFLHCAIYHPIWQIETRSNNMFIRDVHRPSTISGCHSNKALREH